MKYLLVLFLTSALVALPGCTAFEQMQASQTEQTLSAAGFKIVPANTPERRASLAKLPPYQVHRKIKGSSVYYLFPDPRQGILYVGNQPQYNAYQGYAVQQQVASDELMASDEYSADSLGWGDWNIWGAEW